MDRYLVITEDGFGFDNKSDSNNIKIATEDFDSFFGLQGQGKQFRLKTSPTGKGLFDYVEEFTPEPIVVPKSEVEMLKEQVTSLNEIIDTLLVSNLT